MAYYARYRGAGASLLGDNPGVHSKAEADRLIDLLFPRRQVSRAITIAARPVMVNNSTAEQIGTTRTEYDHE